MNPRQPAEADRTREASGEADQEAATPENGDFVPMPGWADQLVAIGRAGSQAETRDAALAAITGACVGISSADHALIKLASADSVNSSVFVSDGLGDDDTQIILAAFANRAGEQIQQCDVILGRGTARLLFVPGIDDQDPSSLLTLIRFGEAAFGAAEAAVAQLAADQATIALRRVKTESEILQRTAERRLISRLTESIVGMQDLSQVLAEVAAAVRVVSGWDAVAVASYSWEWDWLSIDAVDQDANAVPGVPQTGDRLWLADWHNLRFALDNCAPYQLSLELPDALTNHERGHLAEFGIGSLLAIPFALGGEATGVTLLYSREGRALDAHGLGIVQEVGANAALAIQHNQYMVQARQQAVEQAALLRVSKAVISGQDLYAVLAEISRVSLGFNGVEGCRIFLWNKEQDRFEIGAMQSVRDWTMYYQISDTYPSADWPSCRVVLKDKVARGYLVTDPELTARERANHVADQIQSLHRFPIVIGEETVGILSFLSRSGRRFSPNTVRIGQELAAQAAHAIDRARLFGQLQRRAETDGLTGLLNHRAAFETLDRELAAARKLDEPLSIIIVDLDDFKLFNDTHGHLVGDKVLIEVAATLNESSRARDYVARYGGDEFLLILPGTGREQVAQVADRILRKMEGSYVLVGTLELPIRISIGVATFPHDAHTRQELIAYGDAAMYSAKECGGGQLGKIEKRTRSLEVTVFGALSGLVRAVDRKDRYTKDHSDLVSEYAVRLGRFLRLSPEEIDALDVAGQLHDIGKIAVPDSVLRKPGKLTPEEQAMIRQHVVFSEMIIQGIPNLELVHAAVAHHHERWDGAGYPHEKQGLEIPLLGRILTMADALAAMTMDRPYRKGRTREDAIAELRAGAGTQFDPDLVESFISAISTDTAILRDEDRRRRWSAREVSGELSTEVVGLTDYLRQRQEKHDSADDHRDSA